MQRKVDAAEGFRNELGGGRVTLEVTARGKSLAMRSVLMPTCME